RQVLKLPAYLRPSGAHDSIGAHAGLGRGCTGLCPHTLDVGVDGVGDELVGAAGLVLVDHRGPLAIVTHAAIRFRSAAPLCAANSPGPGAPPARRPAAL